MPIPTTLGHLAAAAPALARLAAQPLPVTPAYHIAKLVRCAAVEVDLFTDRRNALITELGRERDATPAEVAAGLVGPVMQVAPEHIATYQARIAELAAIATTLEAAPVDLAALGDRVQVSPADLLALGPLVSEPA